MTQTQPQNGGQNADTPGQIPAGGWKDILWRVKDEIAHDHISVVAAGIAFYGLLSIFPAIAALISIAGLVLDPAEIAAQLESVVQLLPEEAAAILQDQLLKVTGGDETGTGLVALFGILVALYGAMKGVMTLMEGLNIAYDETETRSTVKLYLTAFAITLALIVGLILGMGLMILLPSLAAFGYFPDTVETLVTWLRWPLMAGLTMLTLAALYRFGPSRADPKWRWVSIGAVVATILWILGTLAFTLYAVNFGAYTETYGALGGVVILLTWMWLSAFVVLAGAELNAETEQQTVRDTTTGAPLPMGQREAVKADTMPGGAPQKGLSDTAPRPDAEARDQGGSPTSAGSDLSMAALLVGSALWKTLRRPDART